MQTPVLERRHVRADNWHPRPRTREARDQRLGRAGPAVFTEDELTMIVLFAEGLCVDRIARQMFLSERTVRRRSRSICDRIGVDSIIQVVAWAARRHLI